ncbi:RNA polymerase sigma factor [Sphingobacterium yanglingense]|uniref:RNA polymerase sigma-70 factor (ECF subfamily) n=1 Tax=Sphingobacterium yanglingense TaxID=1437280 RepID=A0A4R6WHT2_9SPHI|nr:sigma-70 family RNA polymerase sigma factor [Sphingobacterium yanglingense]TDQ77901.1 RNA polymerase sigma-70 factor (ECF subfamily) [Sphingobacterium yanglingense]
MSSNASDQLERQLLVDLKRGDHAAFQELYNMYKRSIVTSMLRLLKSPVLVEELVQELFLALWDNRENIDTDRSIRAYLFVIANNMAKNTLRKAYYDKKMRSMLQPFDEQVYVQIDDHIRKKENQALLQQILSYLPSRRREVYTLCKLEQLSYKEVAQRLGITENAVNDHVKKANAQIRDLIVDKEILWLVLFFCIQEGIFVK